MRALIVGAVALVLSLCSPSQVSARYYYRNADGAYWGAYGMVGVWTDADFISPNLPGQAIKIDHDIGWGAGLVLGYQHCLGLRFEGDFGYRRAPIEEVFFDQAAQTSDGYFEGWQIGANVLYEAETCIGCMPVRPYIGAGAGCIASSIKHHSASTVFDDRSYAVEYRGIFGLGYPLTDCIMIAFEYRFIGITDT